MLLPGEWDAAADGDPVEPADDDNDTDTEFADAPLKSKFPPLGEKLFSLALYFGSCHEWSVLGLVAKIGGSRKFCIKVLLKYFYFGHRK